MAEAIGAMSKEHREILQTNRTQLEQNLQAVQLLSYLSNILNQEDDEDVKGERTKIAQARMLLDILPRKGDGAFGEFIVALRKVQPHIATSLSIQAGLEDPKGCIENDEHIMSQECKDRLRSSRKQLEGTDIDHVLRLMAIVLSKMDMQSINCKSTKAEKVDEFISVLQRKESKVFDHFVTVLGTLRYSELLKYLTEDAADKVSKSQTDGLAMPIQVQSVVALPDRPAVQDVPIIKVLHKMDYFFTVTNNMNYGWESLVQEFQLTERKYNKSSNPTRDVIHDWSIKEGNNATTGTLSKALAKLDLLKSKECLEKIESEVYSSPLALNALVKGTENLSIGTDYTEGAPTRIMDLNFILYQKLLDTVKKEIGSKPDCSVSVDDIFKTDVIHDFTKSLRDNRLTNSIMWMKKHLPAGVTGPLLDETTYIRDIPYRVRGPLTMHLTADKNWIPLAEYLHLDPTKIRYIDQQYTNPADEVLNDWQTKRNSTVGNLYDILVQLAMPVIADKVL